MNNIPQIIDLVVNSDLCIGCGLCVYKCPSKALEMNWNADGFLVSGLIGNCDLNGTCITVCPFNPYPEKEVETENELAELFLKDSNLYHSKIGKYNGIYAGYSIEFRLNSSSGGIATYIFSELLERRIVDHIFSVKESITPGTHYEYAICNTKEDLFAASKTKYYPVSLSTVFSKIDELNGKVAIVGVGCFIKAIRLAQHSNPILKEKIPFLVGIICGGVKSRFFSEYLSNKAGVLTDLCYKLEYRIKDENSSANDYSFGCFSKKDNQQKIIKMRTVGDMWGTGLFKANACDFCDDVTTELADISLGDAWLNPFSQDGRGTNIILVRSLVASEIIQDGLWEKKLKLEQLSLEQFIESQQGSYNHRHNALGYRIKQAQKIRITIPPKRHDKKKILFDFKWVQKLRMKVRLDSLKIWNDKPNSINFDYVIINNLNKLKIYTLLYHYRRAINNKILRKLI